MPKLSKKKAKTIYHVHSHYTWLLRILDTAGSFFRGKKHPFDSKQVKRVAVIRFDHIGDVLLSTPVLRALRHHFPHAHITVLVRPLTADLLEHHPDVDQIIALSPPWFSRGTKDQDSMSSARAFRMFAREHHKYYDLVVELHADPRNILFGRKIGKHLVGYDIRGFGFLLDTIATYDPMKKHITQRHLDVVRAIGAEGSRDQEVIPALDLTVTSEERKSLRQNYAFTRKPFFIVHPGTGRIVKEWSEQKWNVLVAILLHRIPESSIVLTGNAPERDVCLRIRDSLPAIDRQRVHVLAGNLNLRMLATIISQAQIIIGPDTGPIHMAYALRTPSVALFGPEDHEVWGYHTRINRSIPFMEQVSPIQVAKTVVEVLKAHRHM